MRTIIVILIIVLTHFFTPNQSDTIAKYKVPKLKKPPKINAVWDKMPWCKIEPITIDNYMGDKPEHIPFTQAKMAYDNAAIYIIFRVKDQYIKAVNKRNQGQVCHDSCVEFFFSPGENSKNGYLNIEMNCGGVMLFNFQKTPSSEKTVLSEDDLQQIEVAHTLPRIIENEITDKTTWSIEYRIPFSMLKKYMDFSTPKAKTIWRANFYKCADKTSHPHWLTWASVESEIPNFHLPEYFGVLEFQK